MKVLFYLPVITRWWFNFVVEPLMRSLADECEIYVLAPAPWRGTGISEHELERCVDMPSIRWCIMDGDDHPSTRTEPEAKADIVAWVRELAPDYVLCRSADYQTIREFPGTVKLLMEGRLDPFPTPPTWPVFQDRPLDHGVMPQLSADERDRLERLIAPAWARLLERHAHQPGERESLFARCGIAGDRPVLLAPLEYEHHDNFFSMHSALPTPNHQLVAELAERVGTGFTLVVTNHPENDRHVDSGPLLTTIAGLENVVLAPPFVGGLNATFALAKHVDGMIVGDSKTYALGAFFGKPVLRKTRFESGAWLRHYADFDTFLPAVAAGEAAYPSPEDARLWFAFHMANNLFDPTAPGVNATRIFEQMDRPVDSTRWDAAFARVRAAIPELFG